MTKLYLSWLTNLVLGCLLQRVLYLNVTRTPKIYRLLSLSIREYSTIVDIEEFNRDKEFPFTVTICPRTMYRYFHK